MVSGRCLFVCGPTASGKSDFAVDLAQRCGGEVVNADAFQLYRGLEVLTAAPGPAQRASVPHHLYGVLGPGEPMDAGRYVRLVRPVIDDLLRRGKTPVVTGGSGLYLKFLTHGPSPLPPGDPTLRAELAACSLAELLARLKALDPVEAARVAVNNRRYVERALEICLLTGQRTSDLRDRWKHATAAVAGQLRGYWLCRPRAELHQRIALRTWQILAAGAIDEVAAMGDAPGNWVKAIGVPEIRALLAGEIGMETCAGRIEAATRQYAKRQETWFRRETWLQQVMPEDPASMPGE